MNLDHEKWLNAPCYCCGGPRRYCAAGGVYQEPDPTDDGPEIDIIRQGHTHAERALELYLKDKRNSQ